MCNFKLDDPLGDTYGKIVVSQTLFPQEVPNGSRAFYHICLLSGM